MAWPRSAAVRGTMLAGGASLLLYALTMAPGVYWGDSAQLQIATESPRLQIGVRAYSAWTVLAAMVRILTGTSPAYAANLANALWGALAVALCYLYVIRITERVASAAAAAASLALGHLLWSSATAAEVYTLSAVLVFLLMLAARKIPEGHTRAFFLVGLIAGLSLLHHRMVQVFAFLLGSGLLLFRLRSGTFLRDGIRLTFGFLVGIVPVIGLAIAAGVPGGPMETFRSFLVGEFPPSLPSQITGPGGLVSLLLYEVRFLGFNMPGPQLVIAAVGLVVLLRRRHPQRIAIGAALFAGLIPPLLFPQVGDRSFLLLPTVCALCILTGLGLAALIGPRAHRALAVSIVLLIALCPIGAYRLLAVTSLSENVGFFRGATDEHRRMFLWPVKRFTTAPADNAQRVFEALPENSILFSGWGDGEVIRYLQEVEGVRPDVRRHLRRTGRGALRQALAINDGRVFLSEYPHLPLLTKVPKGYRLEEVLPGALWRLVAD